MREAHVGQTKLEQHRITKDMYSLKYGGNNQVARIARFLYRDATIYLPRKREVAKPQVRFVHTFTDGLVEVNRRGLRALGEKQSFTLKSLAAKSGIHWSTIFELETSDRLTNLAIVQKLADALESSYDKLLADGVAPNLPAQKKPSALTLDEIHQVRELYREGQASWRELAEKFGVGKSTIGRALRG